MTSVSNARKPTTWHAIFLISDALTVTIMDTLQQIALKNTTFRHTSMKTGTIPLVDMTDQHFGIIATPGIPTMTIETGTNSVDLNLAHITLDIGVTVTVILAEAILDHFTSPHTIALCTTGAQAHITTAKTHHITDTHHAEISPKMTLDPEHIKSNKHNYKPTQRSSSSSSINTLEA